MIAVAAAHDMAAERSRTAGPDRTDHLELAAAEPMTHEEGLAMSAEDGKVVKVDGQLAGSPSVLFDAVAIILSEAGCAALVKEAAAIDFAKDAFGHLKAIGYSAEAKPLLDKAGVEADEGIIALDKDSKAFLAPARTRQWTRERSVRMLA